ncbi:immunoglobulin kappa light chain-like [Seriola aureovittata]|uniref:immunoglobulin kappa light chain-like n=1 Tax=Seriola aureovittata TaxID=2871759 RepID=UPI0024BEFCFB|nr:immunoglobulin kappa light chain-like [Seriola aureovittata]
MMASLRLVLCLTCLFMGKMAQETGRESSSSAHQERSFISANVGGNVTLRCFYQADDSAWLYWYKQSPGQKPNLISTFYVYDRRITFYHEFKSNPRFTLDPENGKNHLIIKDLHISDSATYYCADSYTFVLRFAEGTIVSVQGSSLNVKASLNQSGSETFQPGGSVTLNCTVHTGTCDGEHSVYWFKDSEESHPGLIYTHGDRNDQCERTPETQNQTCFYNLLLENLDRSNAGTYYCAVASCGQILYGNGTTLDFKYEANSPNSRVYFLSGALVFNTVLVVLLASSVYKIIKRKNCHCTESQARSSAPSTANPEGYQDADNLQYAALNVKPPSRSSRQRNSTKTECVYSSIKQ